MSFNFSTAPLDSSHPKVVKAELEIDRLLTLGHNQYGPDSCRLLALRAIDGDVSCGVEARVFVASRDVGQYLVGQRNRGELRGLSFIYRP